LSEVIRQRNCRKSSRGRRSTAHPQRDAVDHPDRKGHNLFSLLRQKITVGVENQVVVQPRTSLPIAPAGRNGKLRRRLGLNLQEKIQCQRQRVEPRTKIC
jgi:hypothetical protein